MRFIIIILAAYLLYRFLKGLFSAEKRQAYRQQPLRPRPTAGGEDLVEDPYCHTYVPLSDAYKAAANGKIYYFCSKKCHDEFKAIKEKEDGAEAL